jgi:hypothetical protein
MDLNGLLGFKGPTHLIPTQTHPFYTPKFKADVLLLTTLLDVFAKTSELDSANKVFTHKNNLLYSIVYYIDHYNVLNW